MERSLWAEVPLLSSSFNWSPNNVDMYVNKTLREIPGNTSKSIRMHHTWEGTTSPQRFLNHYIHSLGTEYEDSGLGYT